MAQYLIIYTGGNQPATPEEGRLHFIKYQAWLQSLGEAVLSPMNPIRNAHTIDASGVVSEGSQMLMSGYTIIEADSIDAAIAMSKTCPFLDIGGSLEVSERVEMPS